VKHVVINPTWRCQLHCAYCWLPHTRINREVKERYWAVWGWALLDVLPAGSVVDVSGGEPLLYPGMVKLLSMLGSAGLRWALTTNGLVADVLVQLCRRRPAGCVLINVSAHNGNGGGDGAARLLRAAGFPVSVNRVDHPEAHYGAEVTIPFQDWENCEALDSVHRFCDAGTNHWVADPAGWVWTCAVRMQMGCSPIGNLFDGSFRPLDWVQECHSGCSSCYRDDPGAWGIEMGPL
jgi:hypothetical protein